MKMRSSSLHYRGGIYYLGDIDIGFIILYDSYKIFVPNINVKFNILNTYMYIFSARVTLLHFRV